MTASEPDPDTTAPPRDEESQDLRADAETQEPQPNPEQAADPEPGRRAGSVGPLLCLGAAVLTVVGSFLELLVAGNLPAPEEQQSIAFTSWTADLGPGDEGETQPIPLNGVPLMGAAAILLVAALIWLLAASRPARPRLAKVRGLVPVVTAVGAAFLAGAVATIAMQVFWWLELLEPQPGFEPVATTVTVGPGFWMLVVGVALATVAAALAWRQRRPEAAPVPAAAATPAETSDETPVLVRRLPDAPPEDPPPAQVS